MSAIELSLIADVTRAAILDSWEYASRRDLSRAGVAAELHLIVAMRRTLRDALGELALLEAREIVLVAAAR